MTVKPGVYQQHIIIAIVVCCPNHKECQEGSFSAVKSKQKHSKLFFFMLLAQRKVIMTVSLAL